MNIFASLVRRTRDRHAYGDLLRLDDHMLRDIGLTRTEILGLMERRAPRRTHGSHE
ncbi:MAG: DUF1127 domain-containing protein [Devosia sp.]